MKKITQLLLLIFISSSYSQELIYIDFGDTPTPGNWNNFSYSDNISAGLINSTGGASGITLTTNSTPATSFRAFNPNGTQSPDASLPFPETATRDSFYGTAEVFGGTGPFPNGTVEFTGLDNTKYYSFSIFASRSATDNREAKYTITGSTVVTATLDGASNAEFTADINNIQPTGGKITLLSQKGDNNTNSFGFYYLGAIEITKTDNALSSNDFEFAKNVSIYPNPIKDFSTISFKIVESAKVNISMYDMTGKMVKSILNDEIPAGRFNYTLDRTSEDNRSINSGLYILEIKANDKKFSTKLLFE